MAYAEKPFRDDEIVLKSALSIVNEELDVLDQEAAKHGFEWSEYHTMRRAEGAPIVAANQHKEVRSFYVNKKSYEESDAVRNGFERMIQKRRVLADSAAVDSANKYDKSRRQAERRKGYET